VHIPADLASKKPPYLENLNAGKENRHPGPKTLDHLRAITVMKTTICPTQLSRPRHHRNFLRKTSEQRKDGQYSLHQASNISIID
jgi:hypothetical protein